MYADDTTIYLNLEYFDQIWVEAETNNELDMVNLWLKLNKLSLNIKKTKLMIFHRKQKKIKDISIDNVQIEWVNMFLFLRHNAGWQFNKTDHTNMVANKISRVTGVLHRWKNIFQKKYY